MITNGKHVEPDEYSILFMLAVFYFRKQLFLIKLELLLSEVSTNEAALLDNECCTQLK